MTLKTVKVFTKRHITRQKIILQNGGMRKARKLLYLLVTIMLVTCIDSILFIFVDLFAPFLQLFFTYLHLSDRMVYLQRHQNPYYSDRQTPASAQNGTLSVPRKAKNVVRTALLKIH